MLLDPSESPWNCFGKGFEVEGWRRIVMMPIELGLGFTNKRDLLCCQLVLDAR